MRSIKQAEQTKAPDRCLELDKEKTRVAGGSTHEWPLLLYEMRKRLAERKQQER